jgi:G:T-mismatch repair DNA endonuclease (very short patch repair protein)
LNHIIFAGDKKIISVTKLGRCNVILLEDGETISSKEMDSRGLYTSCKVCNKKLLRPNMHSAKKERRCFVCRSTGENNPFYGKKHSVESKSLISKANKNRLSGEKNPFYGKKHSPESVQKIKDALKGKNLGTSNHFYGKHHSEKTRQILSNASKKYYENPEHRERSRRVAIKNVQNKKFKMTLPEKITKEWLSQNNIENKYNKIINQAYQYDFLIKNTNILIEVQGDYWHANPAKYGDGPGLKPMNDRQKFKVDRDKIKKEYAEKLGYKIYYIWESAIYKKDFRALEEILNEIQNYKN